MTLSPALPQNTAQPEYNPLDFMDILMGNKDQLYGQVGFDWKGNNESGKMARLALQAIWPVIAQRLASMNMMNPAVEQAIQRVTQALSPEGAQALGDEQYARLQKKGAQQGEYNAGRMASMGASSAAQEGVKMASRNAATAAGNTYLNDLFSPENIANRGAGLIDMQSGLSNDLFNQMLGLGGLVESRYRQNQVDKANGGIGQIAGIIGSLAGMGNFGLGNLFKPKGGLPTIPGASDASTYNPSLPPVSF